MSIFAPASIKIRDMLGLTARGQTTKADALPITLASDEDALAVTGPLTDTELRASDVNVDVKSTSARYRASQRFTFGAVHGQVVDVDLVAGITADWYAIRGASDGDPTDVLTTNALVADYFSAGDVLFTADPIWIYMPINDSIGSVENEVGGWEQFSAYIVNYLAEALTVTLYAVPDKIKLNFGDPKSPITDGFDFWEIGTAVLTASGGAQGFGPNGTAIGAKVDRPIGWLVIKAVPAADPADGYWQLAVNRS